MPPLLPGETDSSSDPFANAIWNALHSSHQHLALTGALARKYPADIAPFSCLDEDTVAALEDLAGLMHPGETTYVLGETPQASDGLLYRGSTQCLQMGFPAGASLPEVTTDFAIRPLSCADAEAMVTLTNAAFPGFFRSRTCLMGSYFGVWDPAGEGRLIAMAGERLILDPSREISAVCTHPDFRGRGLAATLMAHVLCHHRLAQARSVLHVVSTNLSAIRLYHRLGFKTLREIRLHRLKRVDAA
jgi:ribosomal protein S18 acetylase RimI-like enzyme